MKRTHALLVAIGLTISLTACDREADVASRNLSNAADEFQIERRIVFYNGITGEYMLTITGLCSLGNFDPQKQLTVTCKTGPAEYKKHFLGLSDNVTYFAEQIGAASINTYHYEVNFKPFLILPSISVNK